MVIVFKSTTGEGSEQQTRPDSLGRFEFPSLLPGTYSISIWLDVNNNGRYDAGKIFPYQIAEPYKDLPNSVIVRSRWETAEVELKF